MHVTPAPPTAPMSLLAPTLTVAPAPFEMLWLPWSVDRSTVTTKAGPVLPLRKPWASRPFAPWATTSRSATATAVVFTTPALRFVAPEAWALMLVSVTEACAVSTPEEKTPPEPTASPSTTWTLEPDRLRMPALSWPPCARAVTWVRSGLLDVTFSTPEAWAPPTASAVRWVITGEEAELRTPATVFVMPPELNALAVTWSMGGPPMPSLFMPQASVAPWAVTSRSLIDGVVPGPL